MVRQKRSYLYHQSEFQHNYFDFVSLHHSDHDGVVRIYVGHSEIVKRLLIIYIIYAAQFFLYQECNNYITRHNFSPTRSVIRPPKIIHWKAKVIRSAGRYQVLILPIPGSRIVVSSTETGIDRY